MPKQGASIVQIGDKKVIVAGEGDQKGLAVARPMNRAERRRLSREQGDRGAKAKRQRQGLIVESEEIRAAREMHESQQRTIESAQNIRQATAGRFWLPGDK